MPVSPTSLLQQRVYALKLTKILLMAILACALPTGCTNDPEERAFFYHGWMHPETDADQERRSHEALINSSQMPYKKDPLIDQ
jgi:hypothetical protein